MLIHTNVCLNTSRLMPKVSVREPLLTHSQKPPMVLAFGMLRIPGVSSKAPLTLPKAVFVTPPKVIERCYGQMLLPSKLTRSKAKSHV